LSLASARNRNLEVPVYFLNLNKDITSEKTGKKMDTVYIDKCRYEIQEQKEVPVLYTGPF
jgi:hypothetical protein